MVLIFIPQFICLIPANVCKSLNGLVNEKNAAGRYTAPCARGKAD